jgi:hypothetical protein
MWCDAFEKLGYVKILSQAMLEPIFSPTPLSQKRLTLYLLAYEDETDTGFQNVGI